MIDVQFMCTEYRMRYFFAIAKVRKEAKLTQKALAADPSWCIRRPGPSRVARVTPLCGFFRLTKNSSQLLLTSNIARAIISPSTPSASPWRQVRRY